MTFWFRIAFTWWLGHFISCYLTVHFMLIKYTFGSKSQTLRMRYPFQSTGRPISHRNGWSFRVYMIPLRDFVPEWNSRPGTRTGVNSRRGDSRRHNILWWYHVNKYRAMRGNRSELTPGRKSPRCHVKTPPKLWEETATARTIGIPNNEGKRLQPPPGKVGRAKPLSHIQWTPLNWPRGGQRPGKNQAILTKGRSGSCHQRAGPTRRNFNY